METVAWIAINLLLVVALIAWRICFLLREQREDINELAARVNHLFDVGLPSWERKFVGRLKER